LRQICISLEVVLPVKTHYQSGFLAVKGTYTTQPHESQGINVKLVPYNSLLNNNTSVGQKLIPVSRQLLRKWHSEPRYWYSYRSFSWSF